MPSHAEKSKWQEYGLVIGLGLLVAFIITLIMYLRARPTTPDASPSPTPTPVTSLPDKQNEPIEFIDLENESVFDNKSITVAGHTFPNLPVVIFVNQKNFVTTSDEQGNFSLDINLDSGSNLIIITTVDEQGQSYSDQRLVVYTNKSLDEILLTDEELQAVDQASRSAGNN